MRLATIKQDKFNTKVSELWGTDLFSSDAIAELIRSEISSRAVCGRLTLLKSVYKYLSHVGFDEIEKIEEILHILEINGDITGGQEGLIAASPLRAVKIRGGKYKLFGSVPTLTLCKAFDCQDIAKGLNRSVEYENDEAFGRLVDACGGIVMSPERWSGIEKELPAGTDWLKELDERLEQDKRPAASYSYNNDNPWQMYEPGNEKYTAQRDLWKKGSLDSTCTLWRIKNKYSYWVYVWTTGGSPESSSQIRLSGDDALRTMFSLDSCFGKSVTVVVKSKDDFTDMKTESLFPRPEYRYMITMGERIDSEDNGFVYRFDTTEWENVRNLLVKRLGIQVETE